MRKIKKNTIEFIFNPRKKEGEKVLPVIIRWYKDRRKWIDRTLNYCEANQWNSDSQKFTSKMSDYLSLNANLINFESKFNLLQARKISNNEPFTEDDFIRFYEEVVLNDNGKSCALFSSFNEFYKNELITEEKLWSYGTIVDQKKTLKILNRFNPNITVKDLETIHKDYEIFLRSEDYDVNSTIPKEQKNLKKYLTRYVKYCIKEKLLPIDFNPYEDVKIKKVKGNRVDLTMEEVDRIAELQYEKGSGIRLVRDRYLFSCYTGLRIGDNRELHTGFLQVSDLSGVSLLMDRMIKVDYELTLDLRLMFNGKPERLLLSYISVEEIRNAQGIEKKVRVFPYLSDAKTNKYLKVIAKDALINKHLTFHTARHTCGTNLADAGADLGLIMDLLGIKKVETAEVYIHRSNERRRKRLSNLNWDISENSSPEQKKVG